MPFKSSEGQAVTKLTEVFRSGRETLGQAIGGGGGGITLEKISASGGTKSTPGDGFVYHYFTSTDTFTVTQAATDEGVFGMILLSGGAGGTSGPNSYPGGGGGGGGVVYATNIKFVEGSYTITIGGGGAVGAPGGTTSISHPQFSYSYPGGGTAGLGPAGNNIYANTGGATANSDTYALALQGDNFLDNPLSEFVSYLGGNPGTDRAAPVHGGAGGGAGGTGTYVPNQAYQRRSYQIAGPGIRFPKIPTSFFNSGGGGGGGGCGRMPYFFGPIPPAGYEPGTYGGPSANGGGGGGGFPNAGETGGSGAALIWYPELRAA